MVVESTMIIRASRPNCGWIRRSLWEAKQQGHITDYQESTGWLYRSFSVKGPHSVLTQFATQINNMANSER